MECTYFLLCPLLCISFALSHHEEFECIAFFFFFKLFPSLSTLQYVINCLSIFSQKACFFVSSQTLPSQPPLPFYLVFFLFTITQLWKYLISCFSVFLILVPQPIASHLILLCRFLGQKAELIPVQKRRESGRHSF